MSPRLQDAAELSPSAWETVYEQLLATAFPPDELISIHAFLQYRGDPDVEVVVARDGDRFDGIAVTNRQPDCHTALLSYLATRPQRRGTGIGSLLLDEVVRRHDPLFIEIEDPAVHGDRGWGDPDRRMAFYARHGVIAVDVPFFQPPVAPGQPRVDDIILGVAVSSVPDPAVLSDQVRCFIDHYMALAGDDLMDQRGQRLVAALRRPIVHTRPLS